MVGLGGCEEPDLRLEALRGCGLDVELQQLRVTVRGDFPAAPVVLASSDTLPPLAHAAEGITLEGLVGEAGVEAVGRTARIDGAGVLPVYFAPPESRCAVPSQTQFRDPGGAAVGRGGDVLVVGGRAAGGELLDAVLHGRDTHDGLEPLGRLPVPSLGQVLVPGVDRTLWVVGGAGPSGAVGSMVRVDPEAAGDPVSDPVLLWVGGKATPRAFAGVARLGADEALVVGGCRELEPGAACVASAASVLASTIRMDLSVEPPALEAGPILRVARWGARALGSRDGVAFVVGGRGADGLPVHGVERRRASGAFDDFGPDWSAAVGEDLTALAVSGAARLEPDSVVVSLEDGRILWVSSTFATWLDPAMEPLPPGFTHTLETLAGDRILADDFVLPVGGVGADLVTDQGTGTDPAQVVRLAEVIPGPRRTGAHPVLLDDGTVLLVGGRDPASGALGSGAFMLRVRPPLDGPDERLPDVRSLIPGSLVAHGPGTTLEGGGVRIAAGEDEDPRFPTAGVHARGARGRHLRLDVTLLAEGATPHLMLWQGAVAARSIRLGPQVEGFRRDGHGVVESLGCSGDAAVADGEATLRLDITPAAIRIRVDDEVRVTCDGVGDLPASVGLAVSGGGSIFATEFRLARL